MDIYFYYEDETIKTGTFPIKTYLPETKHFWFQGKKLTREQLLWVDSVFQGEV